MINLLIILISTIVLPFHLTSGFSWTKATVQDIHDSIRAGDKTCRQIIQGYLDRISVYNPDIGALINVNNNAISQAIALDIHFAKTQQFVGLLHCAPLVVKDNIDVAGLPTSAGLNIFKYMVPDIDSDAIYNAKQAGAIVLGKANMSPLADKEAWGHSETGGLIRNPYNLEYTTYGSSGGNGAAGAAMLSVLGLGSETGVSVNLPSSAANLVGLRPPVELIIRNGVLPNCDPQDVVGPMAKTVRDVALLLDALTGNFKNPEYSTPTVLNKDGLKNAKLNIFKMFAYDTFDLPNIGTYKVDPQIVSMFNDMVKNMTSSGAVVQNKTIDIGLAMNATMKMFTANYDSCMVTWRNAYFGNVKRYNANAPFHSVSDVIMENRMNDVYQKKWMYHGKVDSSTECDKQLSIYMTSRQDFIDKMLNPLLEGADVAFWPAMPEFPPKLADDAFRADYESSTQPPVNLILAGSWSGYPTIDVPLGFSKPTSQEPYGLPVGAIFIAKPEKLKIMLKIAYAYQQKFGMSKVPYSTPELLGNNDTKPLSTSTTDKSTFTTSTTFDFAKSWMELKWIKISQFFTSVYS